MELHDVKVHLQDHLSDGLVILVGSGLSCAEGVPGMGELADQLLNEIPKIIDEDEDEELWGRVAASLAAGDDLETALLTIKVNESLEKKIANATHEYITQYEQNILTEVFLDGRVLRFSRLVPHLLKPKTGIPVITTNYDRLIEIAAEKAGIAVNTSFCGNYLATFNPKESRLSLCRGIVNRNRKAVLEYAEFLSIYKPHGSLDWFRIDGEPISSDIFPDGEKLIITPGENKFRGGYDRPFDSHRDMANKAIDGAARFLIIGYGFNDEHLQVHLTSQIEKGVPTVVLTHSISDEFREYVRDKKNVWVICSRVGIDGFKLILAENEFEFDDMNIWDLEKFVCEVLE